MIAKQLFIIVLTIIVSLPIKTYACGCTTEGPFLQVAAGATLIAVVEVEEYLTYKELMGQDVPMSMSVKIKRILKGEEIRETITIWGNNGLMCRPYLSVFEEDSQWVMAFTENPEEGHEAGKANDYGLSHCGEYFMKVENNVVNGLIKGGNSYQTMSIPTLKGHIDILNRMNDRIDADKGRFLKQLFQNHIDTIGVFENFFINKRVSSGQLRASVTMVLDDAYPDFYEYMQDATVNRQVFIYWKQNGNIYVKQIDNIFEHDAREATNSDFFDNYEEYGKWLRTERLLLPHQLTKNKKKSLKKQRKVSQKEKRKMQKILARNALNSSAYQKQSIQFFIAGTVFMQDFDKRLFNENYNPKNYKKNRKSLTYSWLWSLEDEANIIVSLNQKTELLFKQYKRLYSLR
jgi:hypothetical protein